MLPCSWQGCKGHIELSAKHRFQSEVAKSKVTLSAKRVLANHLLVTDIVTNISPAYFLFLGAMNEKIANIGIDGKNQFTINELGDVLATNCAVA
jgi:hypothetical protein